MLAALAPTAGAAQLRSVPDVVWQPNGAVNAVLPSADGSRVFIGGDFSYLGPRTGSAVRLDGSGVRLPAWPAFSGGPVKAIVEDGAGGWFVGGGFTHVNGVLRRGLVRVNADGSWDSTWAAPRDLNGEARALKRVGSRLFVGGLFSGWGGVSTNAVNLLELDVATGDVKTGLVPVSGVSGAVNALESVGTWLYVGGEFTSPAIRLMRFDLPLLGGGHDTGWMSTGANAPVHDFSIDPATNELYVAGEFTNLAGMASYVATFASSGTIKTWNPGLTAPAHAVEVSTAMNLIVVGGQFPGFIAGFTRGASPTGAVAWAPSLDGPVTSLSARPGSSILVGGDFRDAGGAARLGAAELNSAGSATTFDPKAGGPARAFAETASGIVMGGDFTSVGGVERRGLAAIDRGTGKPTGWTVPMPAQPSVLALAERGGTLYVGGDLPSPHNGVIAVSTTGSPGVINAGFPSGSMSTGASVRALAIDGSTLYLGGAFSQLGGTAAWNAGAINLTTNNPNSWRPVVNGSVDALATDGSSVFLGGSFSDFAGYPGTAWAAKVDATYGTSVQPWTPKPNGPVHDIAIEGTTVWLAGAFSELEGVRRDNVAAVDSSIGALLPAVADADTAVYDVAPASSTTDQTVWLGGGFSTVKTLSRPLLAQVDGTSGTPTAWSYTAPDIGMVRALAEDGGSVFAGGTSGLAFFTQLAETLPPRVSVVSFGENAPGTSETDGTYWPTGSKRIIVQTRTGPRSFRVRVRAYDRVESTDASWMGTTGLEQLNWPAIPAAAGAWTPAAGSEPGAPRGLKLSCWQGDVPGSGTLLGMATDRSIDYGSARPPDTLPHLPAQLASMGGLPSTGGSFDGFACTWSGYVIGLFDDPGGYAFQTRSDGMRVQIDGSSVVDDWGPWSTPTESTLSAAVQFADEARRIDASWHDPSGMAAAELLWDTPTSAAAVPVPEGAFVTRVEYERDYALPAATNLANGSSTMLVSAVDGGGTSAQTDFHVAIDNTPPFPSDQFTTIPSPGWTNQSSITVQMDDGPGDEGEAGVLERVLSRQLDPSCTDATTGAWTNLAALAGSVDGRTHTDGPLGEGCYRWRLVSRDRVGNERTEYTGWVRIDTTQPGTDGTVSSPNTVTNATSVPVSFTLPSDARSGIDAGSTQLSRTRIAFSGGSCTTALGVDVIASGPITSPLADTTVADGFCYQYSLTVHDRAGNARTITSSDVTKVDWSLPTGTIDSAPASPFSGTVTLTGTASDSESGVSGVSLVTDTGWTICSNAPVSAGTWNCTWDTSMPPDGDHVLQLTVHDVAGNASIAIDRPVIIDDSSPSLSLALSEGTSPQSQHLADSDTVWVNGAAGGSFRVTATADDGSGTGVQDVNFPGLGAGFGPGGSVSAVPYAWDYSWSGGASSITATSVTARDYAGNPASAPFDVLVDSAAPTSGSISYPNGIASAATLVIDEGVDADSGIASWHVERRRATADAAGTCATTWTGFTQVGSTNPTDFTDTTVQRGFCYQYQLVVVDNVGNPVTWTSAATYVTAPAGVIVTETGTGTVATEGGATDTYTVRLRAAPTADVTVTLTGDAQLAPVAAQLTFTSSNWSTAQTVTVRAVDDAYDEVPDLQGATITHTLASSDPDYGAHAPVLLAAKALDNDVAAVHVTPSSAAMAVSEAGATSTYQVKLATQPYGTVNVSVNPDAAQLSAGPSTLTFTGSTWSTAQTVTVAAINDPDIEGVHAAKVTHAVTATASDAPYASAAAVPVSLSITDDDAAGIEVVAAADLTVAEGSSASEGVRVRLRARPAADVTVAADGVAGQLTVAPAALTFTPTSWDQFQTVSVAAGADTLAEPSPHAAQVQLRTSSSDPNFATLPEQVVQARVTDDDPARLATSAGSGWTLDGDGRLELVESNSPAATVRIRAVGDPSSEITITPQLGSAGQIEVSPKSATIPAGSHAHMLYFTFRAVDDRIAEATPHAAKIGWKVTTSDAMYGAATLPSYDVAITDGEETATRDATQPPAEQQPAAATPQEQQPTSTTPPPSDGGTPPAEQQPAGDTEAGTGEATTSSSDDEADAGSSSESDAPRALEDTGPPAKSRRASGKQERAGTVGKLKDWASENKAAASITASAAGTAALWGAKPLLLAGKALGSGGLGLPNTPPGMSQARHLLKLRKKKKQAQRFKRVLGGKRLRGPRIDPDWTDDDDWDEFLWGNDRAA